MYMKGGYNKSLPCTPPAPWCCRCSPTWCSVCPSGTWDDLVVSCWRSSHNPRTYEDRILRSSAELSPQRWGRWGRRQLVEACLLPKRGCDTWTAWMCEPHRSCIQLNLILEVLVAPLVVWNYLKVVRKRFCDDPRVAKSVSLFVLPHLDEVDERLEDDVEDNWGIVITSEYSSTELEQLRLPLFGHNPAFQLGVEVWGMW